METKKSSSLYELDNSIMELIDKGFNSECVNDDGEIDETKVQEYLTNLPIEREKKLEAYGCLVKNLTAEADAIKLEEKNLASRRQSKEKTIERLKDNITASMQLFGDTKFETAKVLFSFRKSDIIEVADLNKVPMEYIKTSISADKTALKQAIKLGEVIEGVSLVEKQNLQIK